jgi:hypothetical protein
MVARRHRACSAAKETDALGIARAWKFAAVDIARIGFLGLGLACVGDTAIERSTVRDSAIEHPGIVGSGITTRVGFEPSVSQPRIRRARVSRSTIGLSATARASLLWQAGIARRGIGLVGRAVVVRIGIAVVRHMVLIGVLAREVGSALGGIAQPVGITVAGPRALVGSVPGIGNGVLVRVRAGTQGALVAIFDAVVIGVFVALVRFTVSVGVALAVFDVIR